uniref:RNB domain-containing protein n=1 Tax=Rhabditophanes sp. KR3021 TaxID=114890 RepID=A0AC35UGB3_9BILA
MYCSNSNVNIRSHGAFSTRVIKSMQLLGGSQRFRIKGTEKFLREKIICGLKECPACKAANIYCDVDSAKPCIEPEFNVGTNNLVTDAHILIFDHDLFVSAYDLTEFKGIDNVIFCHSQIEELMKIQRKAAKTVIADCLNKDTRVFELLDDICDHTFVDLPKGRKASNKFNVLLIKVANYLKSHWKSENINIRPVILCAKKENKDLIKGEYEDCYTIEEYGEATVNDDDLKDRIKSIELFSFDDVKYQPYIEAEQLEAGIRNGVIRQAKFEISRENRNEGWGSMTEDDRILFKGKEYINRACQGDIVYYRILPENEWQAPDNTIVIDDADEIVEADAKDEEFLDMPVSKKIKLDVSNKVTSGQVIGIKSRAWRNLCGVLMPRTGSGDNCLFVPADPNYPKIRIRVNRYEELSGKRIIVKVDDWPSNSRYPIGHYVRMIGCAGDINVENEVILLEHDIPYLPFSDEVNSCLPQLPWTPNLDNNRVDIRHLLVCSVDPDGCTDIDDALHCRWDATKNRWEVGVHIADVTAFVKPGTAIDREAQSRSTSVYLCDRRIDMLPILLSGNLCSLMPDVERYAFSVFWYFDKDFVLDTDIEPIFQKSLIQSKKKFTYHEAQAMHDDEKDDCPLAQGLRTLMKISRILKDKRMKNGALTLASSEVRFDIDPETKQPLKVNSKNYVSTMSMIEEFMLLANCSVALKLIQNYPEFAVLRRHPQPTEKMFEPLKEIFTMLGSHLEIANGKSLSDSLDKATAGKGMTDTLLRMSTTRCMTQALYFCAGSIESKHYKHFGLAVAEYTHFTSPIRRYADVMVHRLLSVIIGAEVFHKDFANKKRVVSATENMNYRHRNAQYASRASVFLNTLLYFADKSEEADSYVMRVKNNGIQVFVPKFGFDSSIILDNTKYSSGEEFMKEHKLQMFSVLRVVISTIKLMNGNMKIKLNLVNEDIEIKSAALDAEGY